MNWPLSQNHRGQRQWNDIFTVLENKQYQSKILYPVNFKTPIYPSKMKEKLRETTLKEFNARRAASFP